MAVANRMVIAIHPDRSFTYEFTKPLPIQSIEEETPLRELKQDIITESPNLEQLQALTYTPRRYWMEHRGQQKRQVYKSYFDQKRDGVCPK